MKDFGVPYVIFKQPTPNFEIQQGDGNNCLIWCFMVKRTLLNKLKYWLFCKFFPFKIVRWE